MQVSVEILDTIRVTHNVRHYRVERPKAYRFTPGQATELSLDKEGWREDRHPFTFTGLVDDDTLEFTIKSYFDHNGMTNELWSAGPGDRLILRDPWGTIQYRGAGVFIAGGAGVTPFIAILRHLNASGKLAGNRLIASNRTEADIILRDEFEAMAGLDTLWTLTGEGRTALLQERIDADFLRRHVGDFDQNFYLCGPDPMVKELRKALEDLGADVDSVTWEK
jgi:propane monooxygenase reductase subunit